METRRFGRTGWQVGCLSLGTVELGVTYGLHGEGEVAGPPPEEAAVDLLLAALEAGVALLDTAPGYGAAEAIVGKALARWPGPARVATKVALPAGGLTPAELLASVAASRERLGRERVDLLQLHNARAADLAEGPLLDALREARARGWVEALGASVYGPADALAAVRCPEVSAVQVALSLLDQRMVGEVLPEARERDVAVLVRSALLKGALTPRWAQLPAGLAPLAEAARRAEAWAEARGMGLAEAALRFCTAVPGVSSVLVGVRSRAELDAALAAAAAPPFGAEDLASAAELAVRDERLVDPRFWGIP